MWTDGLTIQSFSSHPTSSLLMQQNQNGLCFILGGGGIFPKSPQDKPLEHGVDTVLLDTMLVNLLVQVCVNLHCRIDSGKGARFGSCHCYQTHLS